MKIGISISGQTRDFNDEGTQWDSLYELFEGHDISFVGHTWDYCQTPNNVETFRHFEKTSDNDISTWAIQDLSRVPYKTSWNNNPDWINALESDNGIIEIMKKNSIGAFAQTRSFDYTLRYFQQNQSDFDYFIRWRWDSRIGDGEYDSINQQIFKRHLNNWMNKTEDFATEYARGDVLAMIPGSSRRSLRHDTCFAFNKTIVNNLTQNSYFNNLQRAIVQRKSFEPYITNTITAHELWYEYLTLYDACITYMLPKVICINSNPNKENKLWDL